MLNTPECWYMFSCVGKFVVWLVPSQEEVYLSRVAELDRITDVRNSQRKQHDELRRRRLDEFMAGFSVITTRLKEMYDHARRRRWTGACRLTRPVLRGHRLQVHTRSAPSGVWLILVVRKGCWGWGSLFLPCIAAVKIWGKLSWKILHSGVLGQKMCYPTVRQLLPSMTIWRRLVITDVSLMTVDICSCAWKCHF